MEYFDLYDENRKPLHRTHRRGDALPPGAYHIVVEVWTVNGRGAALLTRRDERKKSFPGLWENTSGAVLAGEDSRQGAARELWEETGIRADPSELALLGGYRARHAFVDVYCLRRDVARAELTLQPGETVDARWAALPEIRALWARGEMAAPSELRIQFAELALGGGQAP